MDREFRVGPIGVYRLRGFERKVIARSIIEPCPIRFFMIQTCFI